MLCLPCFYRFNNTFITYKTLNFIVMGSIKNLNKWANAHTYIFYGSGKYSVDYYLKMQ